MTMKVRKENENKFLLYFPETRRIIPVNILGKIVAENIIIKYRSIDETCKKLKNFYPDKNMDDIKTLVIDYLNDLIEGINQNNNSYHTEFNDSTSRPINAEISINEACNLRCRHCFQSSYEKKFMSIKDFCSIIDELVENEIFEINLIGGEVFLNNDIFEMISYCSSLNLPVNITTNATLLNKDSIRLISKHNYLRIYVSLDGFENTHDVIRGKDVFKKVDKNLRLLKEYNIDTGALCTLQNINIYNEEYLRLIDYCRKMEISCSFNLFKPFKDSHSVLLPSPENYFKTSLKLIELIDQGYNISISNHAFIDHLENKTESNECSATMRSINIDTNLRMIPCPGLLSAGYYKYDDLPIFDKDFVENWRNGKIFKSFRERGLKYCQLRSHIQGIDLGNPDAYSIEEFKKFINIKGSL